MAALLLLFVWVGPVTLDQTDSWPLLRLVGAPDPSSADSRVIPAGQALLLEVGTPLRLRLRDGALIHGRFLGRALLDSAVYVPRFTARGQRAPDVPLTLGETLRVVLLDGREWALSFAGYAELSLLLRNPEGPQPLRVPFEFVSEMHRASGERVEPRVLARAFRAGQLPSAEAIALEQLLPVGSETDRWAAAIRVPVEDIESATATLESKGLSAGGIIVLSVIATIALLAVLAAHSKPKAPSCSTPPGWNPGGFAEVHLTTRPFDRSRGCYLGDPLAVADAWPGISENDLAAATAEE